MIKLGSFVCPKESKGNTPVAIVIYDHSINGLSDSFSIKWMEDGHISLRKTDDLRELSPLDFCKEWCKNQMGYDGVKN